MKSFDSLTPSQLRRAAEIKEKIESLSNELTRIFGASNTADTAAPKVSQVKSKMSPAAKAKLSAKLKAIWAKRKAAAPAAPASKASPAKGKMSPAAKAHLSAKLKAYWAKRKTSKKK